MDVFRHIKLMQRWIPVETLVVLAALLFSTSWGAAETKTLSEPQRLTIALEAINRIDADIQTNAALKEAVYNLLPRIKGTPDFVRIVKKFQLRDQSEELLEFAGSNPADEAGVEAMRLLLGQDESALLRKTLDGNALTAARVAEALGNTKEKKAVSLLLPLVSDPARDVVLRKISVRSLAQTESGAGELLKVAKEDSLANDLKLTAATELNGVRWAKIKAQAAEILPLPKTRSAESLPPVAELVKIAGDRANGEKIYFREEVMCGKCHLVHGKGGDIGPALSEIGSKLGKDALLEAILEPSAGISFGYEATSLETKDGDEAYGIVVSETADEVVIKDLNGIVTRHQKTNIAKRRLLKNSLMPDGLAATMTQQELADLVEYLASLKTPGK